MFIGWLNAEFIQIYLSNGTARYLAEVIRQVGFDSSLPVVRKETHYAANTSALSTLYAWKDQEGLGHPLEQVVLNLLSNARDTVDERAEMEGAGYDKRIQIRMRAENDGVVIEVEDNGVGMDEATRQRLFELFFRQRTPTGARVWVCRLFTPLFAITTDRSQWRVRRRGHDVQGDVAGVGKGSTPA